MVSPLYLPANCQAAFQLNWSVSLFASQPWGESSQCIESLCSKLETNGIRLLEWRVKDPNTAQFFVSTLPTVVPCDIVRYIKGRWQHRARTVSSINFRRNYSLASVGAANDQTLDAYVAQQPNKHPMAQDRVQTMFEEMQFHDPIIELTEPRTNNHGRFIYALQIVVESEGNWNDVRKAALEGYIAAIRKTCSKYGWLLSRIGLLANHIHILLAADVTKSPESIALSLLNNLAYSQGMKPVFKFSYYAGTFGPYDRGAIWNELRKEK